MSNRLLRVRELLKRELGVIFSRDFEFTDGLVTVNDVDVTPDLRNAHVFIGVVGGPGADRRALEKIEKNRSMIQKKIGSRVKMKFMPQLHFRADDSVARGVDIVTLMDELDLIDENHQGKQSGEGDG